MVYSSIHLIPKVFEFGAGPKNVFQHPSFVSEPTSVVQSPGSAARLRCSASPPSAAVSWRFRGVLLERGALPGVELGRDSLVISNLTAAHAGVYQCVARLGHGSSALSVHSEISEYEEVRRRTVSVQEGGTVLIECPLPRSVPAARPRLRVRGDWIRESTDNYLVLPSGNLQIVSASARHQGMYKCGAINPVTGEMFFSFLTVSPPRSDPDPSSPVRILYPVAPMAVSAQLSQPLTLECVVSGSPAPAARWFRNGEEVKLGPSRQRRRNNLVFVRPMRSDEGSYSCAVETERGTAVSPNYTVSVLGEKETQKKTFLREFLQQTQLVPLGSSARFDCAATGSPAPNVTWLFNAEPVAPLRRLQVLGARLVVSDVTARDEGVYQCLLDNGLGSAQALGTLRTLPADPSRQRVFIRTDSYLGSTAGAPPEAFPSLHPIQSDESFLTEDDGDAFDPPADRSGDHPVPEAPIIISPPQTHKPDVYDLEWRAGRDGGSPINAYFVKYRKMGTVVGKWQTVRVPGSEKSLHLSELEPSSLYEVLMVARSSAGEGQPAMLTFRTGKGRGGPVRSGAPVTNVPEAPDRPTISMATENSAYVTWIPRANGGSPIAAFRVEYRRGRSAEWLVAADNISPLKLSVEIRNLEPGSVYKFRVVAANSYGDSFPSTASKPYQVPQASPRMANRPVVGPHISSTDAISDTQIMLRWTYNPSSNNNTPIQGFYIYYRPTDSDNDSDYKKDVVEGVKNWHMIAHLQPETSYDIKMQCYNGGGESEYSNVMICETRGEPLSGRNAVSPSASCFHRPLCRSSPGPGETRRAASCSALVYQTPSKWILMHGSLTLIATKITKCGLVYVSKDCWLIICDGLTPEGTSARLRTDRVQTFSHFSVPFSVEYDPPGYLYQPAELNGHVLEYTTLAPGGYGHGGQMLPPGCHHLHHKLPNGLALLNGSGGVFPHGHGDGALPRGAHDCEHPHPHPHHHLNVSEKSFKTRSERRQIESPGFGLFQGGGRYTTLPQTDGSDCMSCQNLCNNNR
uniref:Cell adhesion associated, oncogene regulated n=1 Tax=Kryptolebias marmoratus TaxID=37003 RepID=A0A3Q3AWU5_KRYMA